MMKNEKIAMFYRKHGKAYADSILITYKNFKYRLWMKWQASNKFGFANPNKRFVFDFKYGLTKLEHRIRSCKYKALLSFIISLILIGIIVFCLKPVDESVLEPKVKEFIENHTHQKDYNISNWKPKPKSDFEKNKALFYSTAFEWIKEAECGSIKPPCCHFNPKDPGHFTCLGISLKHNQDLISEIITSSFNDFTAVSVVTTGEAKWRYTFTSVPAVKLIQERYYEVYYKKFMNCPFNVTLQLMDSEILSGRAVKLFQKSQGIKADGIWGKQTETTCKNNPDMEAFKQTRIKRLKSLGICKYFCNGWFKRLDNLEEFINANTRP